jgi:hypothetical protein
VLGSLVIAHDPGVVYDLFKFRRLRLNILWFLRLPLDISEVALLQAMKACSRSLFAHYIHRAECARRSWDTRPASAHATLRPAHATLRQVRTVVFRPAPADIAPKAPAAMAVPEAKYRETLKRAAAN